AILASTALAQYGVNLDELGNGSVTGVQPTPILIQGTIGVDPISGIATLCYDFTALNHTLGITFTTGDVQLFEPGAAAYSDVVRFEQDPAAGTSKIYFFSDIEPNDPGPID